MATDQHLQRVSRDRLIAVSEHSSDPALSFYFPTERAAVQPETNSLHLKSLLSYADDALRERGLRRAEIDDLLERLHDLLDDGEFWLHQWEGCALFRSRDFVSSFRLPYAVREQFHLGDAFVVLPMFGALVPPGHFYVLALSHNSARLLQTTRDSSRAIDLAAVGAPTSLAEALRYDDLQKPELQHHPTTGPGRAGVGRAQAETRGGPREHAFHGHGESGEGEKTQLRRYLRAVDAGVSKLLGAEAAPLVLAGVDYVRAMYRDVTGYRDVVEEGIDGSPDRVSDDRLRELAVAIMEQRHAAHIAAARERYGSMRARGLGSDDLEEILGAAHDGRVATLFVREGASAWGTYDGASRSLTRHDGPRRGASDLLDLAARKTFLAGGDVFIVDLTGGAAAEATFRF